MVFCGKCGLQLSAGDTVCPRCGTPTDPDLMPDESYANNPTIASGATYAPEKTQPNTQGTARPGRPSPAQQPLILVSRPRELPTPSLRRVHMVPRPLKPPEPGQEAG